MVDMEKDARGRQISPSWWIQWNISRYSHCSTTGVAKAMVCTILYVESEKVAHVVVTAGFLWLILYHMSDALKP